MKVLALSDTHYPETDLRKIEQEVVRHNPDLIVIAGDILDHFDMEKLRDYMQFMSKFDQKKLFVPGNHDFWSETLALDGILGVFGGREFSEYGFFNLESQPFTNGDTAFVGHCGWYDHSLFNQRRDFPETHFYSSDEFRNWEALGRTDFKRLLTAENRKAWEDIGEEDFERKVIVLEGEQKPHSSHWYDRLYVRTDASDHELTDKAVDSLEQDLQSIGPARKVIAVTHHLPFQEGVPIQDDPVYAYTSAFLGSARLGDVIRGNPRVSTVIHGHTHNNKHYRSGDVDCYSCSDSPQVLDL